MNDNSVSTLKKMMIASVVLLSVNLACQPKSAPSVAEVERKCIAEFTNMNPEIFRQELSVLCRLNHACVGTYVNLLIRKCIEANSPHKDNFF
jgi:hypothetical protein